MALPYIFMSFFLLIVISAVRCHQRRQLRELEERVANVRERGRYVTDFLYSMGAGADTARINPTSPASSRGGRTPGRRMPRPYRQDALEEQRAIAAAIAASQANGPLTATEVDIEEADLGFEEDFTETNEDSALAAAIAASRETVPLDHARRQSVAAADRSRTPPPAQRPPPRPPQQDSLEEQVVAFDPASPGSDRAGRAPPAPEGGPEQTGGLLGRWVSRPVTSLDEEAALATAIAASVAAMPVAAATRSPSPSPSASPSDPGPFSRVRRRRNHTPSSPRAARAAVKAAAESAGNRRSTEREDGSGYNDRGGGGGGGKGDGGGEDSDGGGGGGGDGVQLAPLAVVQGERC